MHFARIGFWHVLAMLKVLLCLPLLARTSNEFGERFLRKNSAIDGVITLASGLQYKVLRVGTGDSHPTVASPCLCHYEGRIAENYPSGKKFDSSYDRGQPIAFAPNQVIKGWTEAMQLMVEGDKWEMYIPSGLAYGDNGRPPSIPGGAVLIFTMEIIKINGKTVPAKNPKAAAKPKDTTLSGASRLRLVFNVANLVGEPTESSFTLEVRPDWAPLGAKRLQELAEEKFFDDVRFFRVIDGFMAQFGIHGDPSIMRQWRDRQIKDDVAKPGVGNKRGRVSFAMSGANTRTTQLFINFVDNNGLDGSGFTPIAEVVEGMDAVDRLFKVGEGAPQGPGPSQGSIQYEGNSYLNKHFPQLSYVKSCRPVTGTQSSAAVASAVQDLGDGLKLAVSQEGDGKTFPHAGDLLTMHYTLTLAGDHSGKVIDSSRSRNEPFTFTIGRGEVIRGWDQGVMKMSLGQRGMLTVPARLGYGARGAGGDIPPNADLVFDVEVLGIKKSSSIGITPLGAAIFLAIGVALVVVGRFACGSGNPSSPREASFRSAIEMTVGKAAAE